MKKLLIAVLIVTLALSMLTLSACGKESGNETDISSGQATGGAQSTEKGTNISQGTEKETGGSKPHEHSFGEWKVLEDATCTEAGSEERTCDCGEKESRAIPANGHDYVDGVCTLCGKVIPPSEGLEYKLNDDNESYTVIGMGSCSDTDIVIPEVHDGKTVTGIGINAFANNKEMTSIKIPDSITTIGFTAFAHCDKLKNISIPDSVTRIEGGAFGGCTSVTTVTIDKNNPVYRSTGNCIIEIESKTLVSGFKSSTIPSDGSVEIIGYGAFVYCELTNISIPDSITAIDGSAFAYCNKLESIIIPNANIGGGAFESCSELTSVTIGSGVTVIDTQAFIACGGLTSIKVEKGNSKYHSDGNCLIETATKTLVIGCKNSVIPSDGSVTSIGGSAFVGCTGLTSITIPVSVTDISGHAFIGCDSLATISVEKGNSKYHSDGNCLIETATKKLIAGCKNSVIPSDGSVTKIGWDAFYYRSGLTSITIPACVTNIEGDAFAWCIGLTSIKVEQGNSKYHSDGNCLIETATKKLIAGCKTSVIPNDGSVTSIGRRAFYHCSGLTSITIPDSVTSIGYDAFYNCTGLTSITIPDSVTSIGGSAFAGCTGLTSITIPDSVTSIDNYVFEFCTGLTSITFKGTKAQWNAIQKSDSWDPYSNIHTIHCTDGDITK